MTAESVREQAIEAAALAIFDEEGPECIDDDGADALAQVALAAAVPVLLNDLADSIDNAGKDAATVEETDGFFAAAELVRAAAEGWGQ